jgi:hypothetical protein
MKKMLLLIGAGLLAGTLTMSAQTVRLNVDPDYDVYIDDRHYGDNATITTLADGHHSVDVYKRAGGFLGIGKKRTLVNSGSFRLRNNDILIETDANGKLRINELGNTNTRTRGDRDDRTMSDRDDNYAKSKKGRGYGPYDNPGKGHKYGLYKNKKNKKEKDKQHDDRYDDDDERRDRRNF